MTTGNPVKELTIFAIPMILGNLFQQFYNIVDSIIVGKYVGEEALAAVGSSFAITMLFVAVAIGGSIGAGVILSQLYGAKRIGEMKQAVSTACLAFLIFSILWASVGFFIRDPLLLFLKTPENILESASTYLGIYFLGIPFLFMYNAASAVYNAIGDSKTPLAFLIFSSFLNIFLDLWLVIHFNMGVAGAALATLIAQAVSAALSLSLLFFRLHRMKDVSGENVKGSRWFSLELLGLMVKVAVPSIIHQSVISISMLLVQAVVNPYGSSVVAGYAAAQKIDTVAIMPMQAVGNAMSTFTAQNIGAEKQDRVRKGYRGTYPLILFMNLVICVILWIFGDEFLGAFLKNDGSSLAMETGLEYLHIVSVTYFLLGFLMVTGSLLRGAGDIWWFLLATVMNLIARVVCAYGLNPVIGPTAVWLSMPVGWAAGYILNYVRYRQGRWTEKKLI